jgi:hypothetical protein
MARAYSVDLRERVVRGVDESTASANDGLSVRTASASAWNRSFSEASMSRHCSKASSSASASGFDVIQQLQASGSGVSRG